MRNPSSPQSHAASGGTFAESGAIEWEELPSLADSLSERLVVLGNRHRDAAAAARMRATAFERAASSGLAWESTRPDPFDAGPPPQPFREAWQGLAIREFTEPEVFRHFFGSSRLVR
jgi:hypothetical protein